ncbi:response regulator [Halopelagius fulvigenes]|uniref:Response regulator n=1 Tax=Halopelagius fulvigenes TaxID=1198324 RepID=A0ABD5TWJ8_9EURY
MSNAHQRSPDDRVEILLVEDNPGDVRLIREAFKAAGSETTLRPVTNGDDAIDRLRKRVTDESRTLPDIALVDLNLPRTDGCAVVESIRGDPRLRLLPVIMLTGSGDGEDVGRCYDASANAYLTKPTDPDEFVTLAEAVERFWFEHVELPPDER